MPLASSQEATTVVFPAPGGPTTQIAGLYSRASSSSMNSRSLATALCSRGRVSFANREIAFGTSPPLVYRSPWTASLETRTSYAKRLHRVRFQCEGIPGDNMLVLRQDNRYWSIL